MRVGTLREQFAASSLGSSRRLLGPLVTVFWSFLLFAPCVTAEPLASQPADLMPMVYACRQAYASVKDFTAVIHRRERVKGEVQAEETIAMKFRTNPFSVYMRWVKEPHRTREVIFVENQNEGLIVAHEVVGFVNWFAKVSPTDPRAQKESHHSIAQAGIGKAVDSFISVCETAKKAGDLRLFSLGQDIHDNRPTDVLIRILPQKPMYPYHILMMYIDKQFGLPVRFITLNWDYELETMFGYYDLKLNVGLTDEDFNYKSKEYGFMNPLGLRAMP